MIPSSENEKANAGTIYNVRPVHSKLGNSFTDMRKGLWVGGVKSKLLQKIKK